jgi:hypothetical protein
MGLKIQGKQLENHTITQNNLNIPTDSIINPNSVTNKEWVDAHVTEVMSGLTYATSNLNMIASETIKNTGSQLGCSTPILHVPNSNITVSVNGIEVNIGDTSSLYHGFFSPDGIIIRIPGTEVLGDFLYWNTDTAIFQLDNTDEIDFIYLTKI